MVYQKDPGGVFDSDTHRRVAGHLPLPSDDEMELNALGHRLSPDRNHELTSVAELEEVLKDLLNDGYASQSDLGWRLTQEGLDALQAPVPVPGESSPRPALLRGLEGELG